MPKPVTPHLALPLQVVDGVFVASEQGSPRHCQDQAEFVTRTRPTTLEADPAFGMRDLVGRLGPAAPEVQAALEEYVPDVKYLVDEDVADVLTRVRDVSIDLDREQTS